MKKVIIAVIPLVVLVTLYAWRTPPPKTISEPGSDSGIPVSDAPGITVTDLAGRQVTIRQPVERIVLMRSLCIYELAAVLGDEVEDRLVGWDSSLETGDRDTYQAFVKRFPRLKEVTVLGDVLRDTVSAEAVLALEPDLVVMNTYMRQRHSKGLERLEQSGIPLLYWLSSSGVRSPGSADRF